MSVPVISPKKLPTARAVRSVLDRSGVEVFKLKRRTSGMYVAEFRRMENQELSSADALAQDILFALNGGANIVGKFEWFRDWQIHQPRSCVVIEFKLAAAA